MSMSSKKAIFRLQRNEVGDCTIDLSVWRIFRHKWSTILDTPTHFTECMIIIKEWCYNHDINTAVVFDPDGVNKKMVINY